MRSIPIGVVPLGRENRFYQSHHSTTAFKSPVRYTTPGFVVYYVLGVWVVFRVVPESLVMLRWTLLEANTLNLSTSWR